MGALPVTSMPLNQMPGSPNASTGAVSSVPAAPLAAANPNEACNADSSSSKCILGASSVVTVVNDSHTGAVGGSNAILNDSVKDYSSRFAAGAAWPPETFEGLCLVLEDPEQGRKERTVKAITQCMRRVSPLFYRTIHTDRDL